MKHESYHHRASLLFVGRVCVLKASLAIVIVIAVVGLAAIFTRALETDAGRDGGPCLPRPIIIFRTFTETV